MTQEEKYRLEELLRDMEEGDNAGKAGCEVGQNTALMVSMWCRRTHVFKCLNMSNRVHLDCTICLSRTALGLHTNISLIMFRVVVASNHSLSWCE